MSQQRKVHHVFDQMPHQVSKLDSSDNEQGEMSVEVVWDEKAQDAQGMLVHDNLLKQLSLGTDNSVGEDWVSDKQKQVPIHDSVIWDDESIHNIDSHVGLLQQLAQSSCEWEPTTRLFINGLPAHTNDAFLLSEVSKKSADEMCSDLTHETVLWNEERKLVEDNKVVWDDELLENDESQDKLSVLEVDEEAPCGENAKLTEAGVDLQLSPSSQEAIRKLEVGMYVAEQVYASSFVECIHSVDQHLKEKMPAWRCNGFSPGTCEQHKIRMQVNAGFQYRLRDVMQFGGSGIRASLRPQLGDKLCFEGPVMSPLDQCVCGHNDVILLVVVPAMQAADVASSQALRMAKDIDSDGLYLI